MQSSIHEAIYHGFEHELANATAYVLVDDMQQDVYSVENAALALKIGAEIESVAKAICKKNGTHKDGHKFDSSCIEGDTHKIDTIALVNKDFYFEDVANTIFWPFKKDEKKYNSEQMTYGWNNAYQNVKHGSFECIKKFGTIRYIIRLLGTLYVLNYELSGETIPSRFFAYVSEDKIIGQKASIVFDNIIDLIPK